MREVLLNWLEKVDYRVEEPDDHTVELWCQLRLVARFTPSVSRARLHQVAADDYIVHRDWKPLRSEP